MKYCVKGRQREGERWNNIREEDGDVNEKSTMVKINSDMLRNSH